jgi:phenylacetate-coenzyme A ligase PaaK-like adenylate-forming protein
VLLSADYAPDSVMKRLRETWGARVFSHYGMTETCFGAAVQCGFFGARHIRNSEMLVEIVDPESGWPLPPGSEGEVVITTFAAEAMPLLRYRTGDISSIASGRCPCGGFYPALGKVKGRAGAAIRPGNRAPLALAEIDEEVYSFPPVVSYEASSNGRDSLRLTIAALPELDRETLEERVRSLAGPGVDVGFGYTENFRPSKGHFKRSLKIIK